jgi:hypothetical protein
MTHPQALPHVEKAIVAVAKLRDYALNPQHPRGGSKARVFASALGYTRDNWRDLAEAILRALPEHPAVSRPARRGGQEFAVDLLILGPRGRATVRTGWMIDTGQQAPRLTTLYVNGGPDA